MFRKFGYRFLIITLLVLIWWLMRRPREEQDLSSVSTEIIVPSDEIEPSPIANRVEVKPAVSASSPRVATKAGPRTSSRKGSKVKSLPADDLKRISGIGPKISSVLQKSGITSFSQLANMQPAEIKKILEVAGIRLANPETWPEQARKQELSKLNLI